jgi:hypothetical protein
MSVLEETTCSLNELAKRAFSARGRGPSHAAHRTTVLRWIIRGVKVNGVTVKLEAKRIGRYWATSFEAYDRFIRAMNQRSEPNVQERTPAELARANENAIREIEARKKRLRAQR